MKNSVVWKEGMVFDGLSDGHRVTMDAKPPIGKNSGASPKELVALGLGGCTAMDVIALLKKHHQIPKSFSVDIEIEPSTGRPPIVFAKAVLFYRAEGEINPDIFIDAVKLSQTKYCGVSAMLSKALPIEYSIILNGKEISKGSANFDSYPEAQVVS